MGKDVCDTDRITDSLKLHLPIDAASRVSQTGTPGVPLISTRALAIRDLPRVGLSGACYWVGRLAVPAHWHRLGRGSARWGH